MKNFRFLHFSLAFLLMVGSSAAQSEEWFGFNTDGIYLGTEMGVIDQDDFELDGRDNDFATRCDQILFEDTRNNRQANSLRFHEYLENGDDASFVGEIRPDGDCGRGDAYSSDDDAGLDTGAMISFQMGYRFNPNLRVELEYMYRAHTDGDSEPVGTTEGDKESEFPVSNQAVTSLSSHSALVNLYWDFINDSAFTPYIGVGAGVTKMRLDYGATFTRHSDPDVLSASPGRPPGEAAGTTTLARTTLRDSVGTWQVLAGVDYAIDPNWLVGVKARYIEYSTVKDNKTWDQLRGHDSRLVSEDFYNGLSPDLQAQIGDPVVRYEIETEDVGAWAIGVGVKRLF